MSTTTGLKTTTGFYFGSEFVTRTTVKPGGFQWVSTDGHYATWHVTREAAVRANVKNQKDSDKATAYDSDLYPQVTWAVHPTIFLGVATG